MPKNPDVPDAAVPRVDGELLGHAWRRPPTASRKVPAGWSASRSGDRPLSTICDPHASIPGSTAIEEGCRTAPCAGLWSPADRASRAARWPGHPHAAIAASRREVGAAVADPPDHQTGGADLRNIGGLGAARPGASATGIDTDAIFGRENDMLRASGPQGVRTRRKAQRKFPVSMTRRMSRRRHRLNREQRRTESDQGEKPKRTGHPAPSLPGHASAHRLDPGRASLIDGARPSQHSRVVPVSGPLPFGAEASVAANGEAVGGPGRQALRLHSADLPRHATPIAWRPRSARPAPSPCPGWGTQARPRWRQLHRSRPSACCAGIVEMSDPPLASARRVLARSAWWRLWRPRSPRGPVEPADSSCGGWPTCPAQAGPGLAGAR